ncbi:MAG: hypothetical protein ACOYN0_18475, partial [Phycisphaerales bacterium]
MLRHVPAGLCAVALWCSASHAQTIQAVRIFPGGGNSAVYGISVDGFYAAGYSNNAASTDTSLRWYTAGGSTNLGLLPGGLFNSYAKAISGDGGTLVGYGGTAS